MINLSTLKNFSHAKKYMRSAVIARENMGTEMYIILKGDVGVFVNYRKQNEERISMLGPGDYFGETALFLEKAAPYTTVALTDVILLPINRNIAGSFIREEPDASLELMKAMCTRLDTLGTAYAKLNGHLWADNDSLPKEAPAAQAEKEPSPPSPAPAASPAAEEQSLALSVGFSLFPEGHGSYQLQLNSGDRTFLMERGHTCPICKREFKTLAVRASRLIQENTDSDMRHRYKGIEPLYYDVVTCPNCLYSALSENFNSPDILKADLSELKALKAEAGFTFGVQMDTTSVFAGYYLALLCAPKCFAGHHLATAKLLLKLSRVYQDCGDGQMEEITAKRALDAYLYIYLNEQSDMNQDQQLCIIIGELFLKLNDLKNARDYFFKAKTNRFGSPLLKNQAENRLLHIRELEGNG